MQDKAIAQAGSGLWARPAECLAAHVMYEGPAQSELGEHPVALLSAAVLTLARRESGMSRADLAARASVPAEVVDQAENGIRPAWALPYHTFTAVADTVASLSPWMRGMFETAATCDLLLSCILEGSQAFATDALGWDGSHDLAWAMLRWAISGRRLDRAQLSLLATRASALAGSSSPDAWVGEMILALCRGDR
jgi:hypothetical protein